jgi:hypothetical protein
VDSRLTVFRKIPDLDAAWAELGRAQAIQREIWTELIAATKAEPTSAPVPILLLTAVNHMIEISTTRTMVSQMHSPPIVYVMLVVVLLTSALYVGYGTSGSRWSWVHVLGFVLLHTLVFGVIRDLEFPRIGFLREESFDQALVDLRRTIE